MSRYLVTGGLGVIGSRFVDLVVRDGHSVTIIDAAEAPRNRHVAKRLETLGGSVSIRVERLEKVRVEALSEIVASHDGVLHAAAHTGIPHSEQDPGDDWFSNVDATRNLLEAMRVCGRAVPAVMLSSVKPYRTSGPAITPGDGRYDFGSFPGFDEDTPLEPDEPYAASKMAQSALGMAYGRTYGIPVVVLRCSNLYGDAPCHGPRHGWLTWFCISAALGWPIDVQGSGLQTRDMLFCTDVTSAVLAALEKAHSLSGQVFNIGGGPANTVGVSEAVRLLRGIAGREVEVTSSAGRKNEDSLFVTDFGRFSKATGWAPAVGVPEGMRRIVDWARSKAAALKDLYGR